MTADCDVAMVCMINYAYNVWGLLCIGGTDIIYNSYSGIPLKIHLETLLSPYISLFVQ